MPDAETPVVPSSPDVRINELMDKFLSGTAAHEELFELYGLLEVSLEEEKKKNPQAVRIAVLVTLFWTLKGLIGVLQSQAHQAQHENKSSKK